MHYLNLVYIEMASKFYSTDSLPVCNSIGSLLKCLALHAALVSDDSFYNDFSN